MIEANDFGWGIYFKTVQGDFEHQCLKISKKRLFVSILQPQRILCDICHAIWDLETNLKPISHKLICPDCGEPFSLDLDASQISETYIKKTKDGFEWSEFICRQCAKSLVTD